MKVFGPSDSKDEVSDQSPHYGELGGSQFPITTALSPKGNVDPRDGLRLRIEK